MEGGRRRRTLYDQMLAVRENREIAGLTLNDVLTLHKRASPNRSPAVQLPNRTLLDIIRTDDFHIGKEREKKLWKLLRNRLRLNRNPVHFDQSDEMDRHENSPAGPTLRPQLSRRVSARFDSSEPVELDPVRMSRRSFDHEDSPDSGPTLRPQLSRRVSARFDSTEPGEPDPVRSLRPQMSRRNSTRVTERGETFGDLTEPAREGTRRLSVALAEERALSAREAVAAQEAADAESAVHAVEPVEPVQAVQAEPVRMSLMDLLEETDRQMGLEGSRYRIEEEEEEEEREEEEEEREEEEEEEGDGRDRNCCVCMVRHRGAAFIPCGHTFCRLCSRELWVSRGNCPLCNGFILEILDIF